MESGLASFFNDLRWYTFAVGLYVSIIYGIEFAWIMELRRDLKREKPDWCFRYTFWEFCLFLLPLAVMLSVVAVQAARSLPPPTRPMATEEPAILATFAIHGFLASEGAMLVAKLRQIRADEKVSAARVMAVWCGVFFCMAVMLST